MKGFLCACSRVALGLIAIALTLNQVEKMEFSKWVNSVHSRRYTMKCKLNSNVFLFCLVLGLCLVSMPLAAQSGNGSISGRVENRAQEALENVIVKAYSLSYQEVGSAATDQVGNYQIDGLASGEYKVFFFKNHQNYQSEWYSGKNSFYTAEGVHVTAGNTTPGISAVLKGANRIMGRVLNSNGDPLSGIGVTAMESPDHPAYSSSSGEDGYFYFWGLPRGIYKLRFFDGSGTYATEWYNNKSTFAEANGALVTNTDSIGLGDIILGSPGRISGRVTDHLGSGKANVAVLIYPQGGELKAGADSSGLTDSEGYYDLGWLAGGNYTVSFIDAVNLVYANVWYNGKTGLAGADLVTVIPGQNTTGIDAVLQNPAGRISGRVTDNLGQGIPKLSRIRAYDQNNHVARSAFADANGYYTINTLPAGSYRIEFTDNSGAYQTQWYSGKANSGSADLVVVTEGNTTEGINATMIYRGSISGLVTNPQLAGLANIDVDVFDLTNRWVASGRTAANGNYSVAGLSTGSYKAVFIDRDQMYHQQQWYNAKGGFQSADVIGVTAGVATNGIDATLASAGRISGRVTNQGDQAVPWVFVYVYDQNHNYIAHTQSKPDGNFTLGYLPGGNCKVWFRDLYSGHVFQWYNDKPTFAAADAVPITVGATTTGINARLAQGGSISGTVSNASGIGIAGIFVVTWDMDSNSINYVQTDVNGGYTINGLPGQVKVKFYSNGQNYVTTWYSGRVNYDTADPVTVTPGSTTTGIDAQLLGGGSATGRVTNTLGVGLEGINVWAYNLGNSYMAGTTTDSDGNYLITGLPNQVKVDIFDPAGVYSREWYNNKATFGTADTIDVTAGGTQGGINAELAKAGITVLSPNGGESWKASTVRQVTWTALESISNVKIELSFNSGALWGTIVDSTPNVGSYNWTIGTHPSTGCLIRISNADDPTQFDVSDAEFVLQSPVSFSGQEFAYPVSWSTEHFGADGWRTGDFDGDGKADILRYDLNQTMTEVFLSSGTAFEAAGSWLVEHNGSDGWYTGDFNGDGKTDLLRYNPGVSGGEVFLSDGAQFVYDGSWTGEGYGADGWYIGDFNGDGKADLLRYNPGVSGGEVFLSDGTQFVNDGSWTGAGNGADGWYIGDFDGDGRDDLMRFVWGVGTEVFFSDGTKFEYAGVWTGAGNGNNGWYLGDFTGNNRTDIMRYVLLLSGAEAFLNMETVFSYEGSWSPAGQGDDSWHLADFNGDGRCDLMRYIHGLGVDVLLSRYGSSYTAAPMKALSSPRTATGLVISNEPWLGDVPKQPLSAEEQAFVDELSIHLAQGETPSIHQLQQDYRAVTGRPATHARIMKLIRGITGETGARPEAGRELDRQR